MEATGTAETTYGFEPAFDLTAICSAVGIPHRRSAQTMDRGQLPSHLGV